MSSNNTSKTAHVMNLLSKNRSSAAAEPAPAPEAASVPQAEAAPPQADPAPAHTAPVAPIISSINADAAVSSQIKDALEAELAAEAPQAAPVRQTAPVQETPVHQAVPPVQDASVQEAPAQAAPPAQEAPVWQEPPAQESFTREPLQPEGYSYVNVMQILVEEKADEYMKMFGICCCDKCRVDVRAYALNHLPPKYVVMSQHERVPRLTVYESRFASDITAQLIRACKTVMLTPHHTSKDDSHSHVKRCGAAAPNLFLVVLTPPSSGREFLPPAPSRRRRCSAAPRAY